MIAAYGDVKAGRLNANSMGKQDAGRIRHIAAVLDGMATEEELATLDARGKDAAGDADCLEIGRRLGELVRERYADSFGEEAANAGRRFGKKGGKYKQKIDDLPASWIESVETKLKDVHGKTAIPIAAEGNKWREKLKKRGNDGAAAGGEGGGPDGGGKRQRGIGGSGDGGDGDGGDGGGGGGSGDGGDGGDGGGGRGGGGD
jgi:hypothetical protein